MDSSLSQSIVGIKPHDLAEPLGTHVHTKKKSSCNKVQAALQSWSPARVVEWRTQVLVFYACNAVPKFPQMQVSVFSCNAESKVA